MWTINKVFTVVWPLDVQFLMWSINMAFTVFWPSGEMYDIGWGQRMFLSCRGKGAPTVVLDAPTGMNSDAWNLVYDKVAKYTRVRTCLHFSHILGTPTPFSMLVHVLYGLYVLMLKWIQLLTSFLNDFHWKVKINDENQKITLILIVCVYRLFSTFIPQYGAVGCTSDLMRSSWVWAPSKAPFVFLSKKLYPYCLVLVGSRNGFERIFTIKLKWIEGLMEDWLKCQISPLVKYRQNQTIYM